VRLKTAIGGTWLPETIGNIIGVAILVGLVYIGSYITVRVDKGSSLRASTSRGYHPGN
jgi:formate/nitrite transporter FocA (FNT family)